MRHIHRAGKSEMKKAVVLLSGGLDSAVTLYAARNKGYTPYALTIDYGQRHKRELDSAKKLARKGGARLKIIKLDLPWKGSSLLDRSARLPSRRSATRIKEHGIPSTYVPARNTIFLSMAVSYAEAIGASAVFIGAHSEDSSGYPDCRPGYLKAFGRVVRLGTKSGIEKKLRLEYPLIGENKAGIIGLGISLGVPFHYTWSCYKGGRRPCGECDSCVMRRKGFEEAGLKDPSI